MELIAELEKEKRGVYAGYTLLPTIEIKSVNAD
jgi:anthranilate/para-aminobenzoate synthase component I